MTLEREIEGNSNSLYELVHPECKKYISKEYCDFFQKYLIPLGINFPEVLVNPNATPISVEEIKLPCEIEKIYPALEILYDRFLKEERVKFHELKKKTGEYKGTALALAAFISYPFHFIHKDVLSKFIRDMTGNSQGDFQARHLAAQNGWNILNKNESYFGNFRTKSGFHMITDFTVAKLGYMPDRREDLITSFDEMKKLYGNRCATCGAKEGEAAPKNLSKLVALQRGHCDPSLPLTDDNTIPQCEECNQLYKNDFVFDLNGVAVALGTPKVFKNTSDEVRRNCYTQLNLKDKIFAVKSMLDDHHNEEDRNKLIQWLQEQLKN
jgi:hypothetical protein